MDNYLFSSKLYTRDIHCINDSSNSLFKSKTFNEIFHNYNRISCSMIFNVTCKISIAKIISKINSANGFYYVLFNITRFAHCAESYMLALEQREFVYEI